MHFFCPLKHDKYCPDVSISSGYRNFIKTYHNDDNTSGITKIALKNFFWTFFDKKDRLAKLQKSDFQSHFSTSKIVRIFTKKKFIEEYDFRGTLFVNEIF